MKIRLQAKIDNFAVKNIVRNLFSGEMIHDLLESHNFLKFGKKR